MKTQRGPGVLAEDAVMRREARAGAANQVQMSERGDVSAPSDGAEGPVRTGLSENLYHFANWAASRCIAYEQRPRRRQGCALPLRDCISGGGERGEL